MAKKLSKRVKKQLLNIGFLVLLIAVTLTVVFVSQDINLGDIGNFLSACNPWYIVGAFCGLLGYIIFEALSLHVIARKLGQKPKFASSVAYSASDLYYSAITPSASGGQPASAYYMMRDGMPGGTASFVVLFNLIGYTVATIIVGLFGLIACPWMFGEIGHWLAKLLVIVGFVIQGLLLAALLLCLFRARIILAIGKGGITLLNKMRIIKNKEKWVGKLEGVVEKYRACRTVMKQHPVLFFATFLFNIAQRASQTLIPCFVMYSASPDVGFLELFCMQAYVMIGYNSIPLPGGTGVYEYLYPNIFGIGGAFSMKDILSAMMVSRAISYYACMIVCGLYTLVYHACGIRKIKGDDPAAENESENPSDENSGDETKPPDESGEEVESPPSNNPQENTDTVGEETRSQEEEGELSRSEEQPAQSEEIPDASEEK